MHGFSVLIFFYFARNTSISSFTTTYLFTSDVKLVVQFVLNLLHSRCYVASRQNDCHRFYL